MKSNILQILTLYPSPAGLHYILYAPHASRVVHLHPHQNKSLRGCWTRLLIVKIQVNRIQATLYYVSKASSITPAINETTEARAVLPCFGRLVADYQRSCARVSQVDQYEPRFVDVEEFDKLLRRHRRGEFLYSFLRRIHVEEDYRFQLLVLRFYCDLSSLATWDEVAYETL